MSFPSGLTRSQDFALCFLLAKKLRGRLKDGFKSQDRTTYFRFPGLFLLFSFASDRSKAKSIQNKLDTRAKIAKKFVLTKT